MQQDSSQAQNDTQGRNDFNGVSGDLLPKPKILCFNNVLVILNSASVLLWRHQL